MSGPTMPNLLRAHGHRKRSACGAAANIRSDTSRRASCLVAILYPKRPLNPSPNPVPTRRFAASETADRAILFGNLFRTLRAPITRPPRCLHSSGPVASGESQLTHPTLGTTIFPLIVETICTAQPPSQRPWRNTYQPIAHALLTASFPLTVRSSYGQHAWLVARPCSCRVAASAKRCSMSRVVKCVSQ
jgi:hypothetical protein